MTGAKYHVMDNEMSASEILLFLYEKAKREKKLVKEKKEASGNEGWTSQR